MLQLSLLRHAKSSWEHEDLTDHERPLKERGMHDTKIMAQEILKRNYLPDQIISSTSRRTRETIQRFLDNTSLSESIVSFDRALYHAWAKDLLKYVQQHGKGNHVMLVGHNPGIHEFLEHISDERIEKFPTCGFAIMSLTCGSWKEAEYGCAKLDEFIYPSMFR
jgi:phosphohistidine phosphatase